MWFGIYHFLSAIIFLCLGTVWDRGNFVQLTIKYLFWFLFVWGVFLGMLAFKGYHV